MVDSVSRRSSVVDFELPDRDLAGRAPRPPSTPPQARGLDAFIDGGIAQAVRQVASARPRSNDDVQYIGLNETSAKAEVAALRTGPGKVAALAMPARPELETDAGCTAFVDALGLPARAAADVLRVLTGVSGREREILAAIAASWAPGERGATLPSRLVISGHSGSGVWIGGGENTLDTEHLHALATALPRAAAQIEDVHLSACSTSKNAGDGRVKWTKAFPNMKTMWGYNGAAPSPAAAHLATWSTLTRGRADAIRSSPGTNVAVWSAKAGYVDGGPSVSTLRARQKDADSRYEAFASGSRPVGGPEEQPCERDYRTYRALADHPNLGEEERSVFRVQADTLLRIREYGKARAQFADTYANEIGRGYAAVGESPPSFATMSRAEALREVARFDRLNPASAAAMNLRTILDRFAALDPGLVRDSWVAR